MISESDISECCERVARRDLQSRPQQFRSSHRVLAERVIVRHTLHGLQAGKSGLRLKWHVLRRSRIEAGISIQAWLMVASLLLNVTKIVIEWWRERNN